MTPTSLWSLQIGQLPVDSAAALSQVASWRVSPGPCEPWDGELIKSPAGHIPEAVPDPSDRLQRTSERVSDVDRKPNVET